VAQIQLMTKTTMKMFKIIFQLLRRCLLGLFIAYWVVFVFYTVEKFLTGGSSAVVGWYEHIDSSLVHQGDGWFLTKWSWGKFWLAVCNTRHHFGAVFRRAATS